jgi:hypothetical protein
LIVYFLSRNLLELNFSFTSLWDPVNVYGGPMEGNMITTGTPLATPPLVDMISNDPILGGVKVAVIF